MEKEKIKNKFKDCFKNCALARVKLKKCIVKAMDAGLNKTEVLALANETPTGVEPRQMHLYVQ